MRLTKIYIESFGVLRDYTYIPTAGFNQIYGENGTGKSTLAAFIRAMFFGMPQTRTRKLLDETERKKFKSWQGGKCGGYICFEENGKEYRVTRTFGDRESEDTFSLTDEASGLVSGDYSSCIGTEIFGIDREAFSSTIWIASKNMPVAVNDSIHAKLSSSGENKTTALGRDMDNYDKGMERLNEAYKKYARNGRRGLIYETEDEIADLKLQMQEKQKRLHAVSGMIESLNKRIESRYMSVRHKSKGGLGEASVNHISEAADSEENVSCKSEAADSRENVSCKSEVADSRENVSCKSKAAGSGNEAVSETDNGSWRKRLEWLDDYFSKGVPEESGIENNIAANERKVQLLEAETEKLEQKQKSIKKRIVLLSVLSVLSLIVIAAAVMIAAKPEIVQPDDSRFIAAFIIITVGIAAFVGFCIWLIIIISRFNKIKTTIKNITAQMEQLKKSNDNLKEQRGLIAEYSYLSEKDMYREKLEKQLDVQKYKLELDNYYKEQEQINSEITNILHNINRKQKMLEKYNYDAAIIKKTSQYLTEARNSYVLGYRDLVADKMADYLACFDKKLAASLRINADFVVSIAIGALDKDLDYFSSGIKDIIWFCERLAIIDAIFDKETFIIMDDTFINMDDNILGKALELTAELAKKRQIIYMTCRKSNMYRKKE